MPRFVLHSACWTRVLAWSLEIPINRLIHFPAFKLDLSQSIGKNGQKTNVDGRTPKARKTEPQSTSEEKLQKPKKNWTTSMTSERNAFLGVGRALRSASAASFSAALSAAFKSAVSRAAISGSTGRKPRAASLARPPSNTTPENLQLFTYNTYKSFP